MPDDVLRATVERYEEMLAGKDEQIRRQREAINRLLPMGCGCTWCWLGLKIGLLVGRLGR